MKLYLFDHLQANALVNSLIGENRISTLGLAVVDEVCDNEYIVIYLDSFGQVYLVLMFSFCHEYYCCYNCYSYSYYYYYFCYYYYHYHYFSSQVDTVASYSPLTLMIKGPQGTISDVHLSSTLVRVLVVPSSAYFNS